MLKRAVVRSLEIIGEATQKIPADFKISYYSITINSIVMDLSAIHGYPAYVSHDAG